MWWMFAAQAAMSLGQAGASASAEKQQYKAQKAWQQYSNAMTNIGNAINQNTITTNEILNNEAFAGQAIDIKRGTILNRAQVATSAAAAGVKGRSVNQAMNDVLRNAAMQESERQISFRNSNLAFDAQRLQSQFSANQQQDYSYIPKPNSASHYLGALSSIAGNYMSMSGNTSGGSGGVKAPTGKNGTFLPASYGPQEKIIWKT